MAGHESDKLPPEVKRRLRDLGYKSLTDFADKNEARKSTIYSVFLNSAGQAEKTLVLLCDALAGPSGKPVIEPEQLLDLFREPDPIYKEDRLLELLARCEPPIRSFNQWAIKAGVAETTLRKLRHGETKCVYQQNAREAAGLLNFTLSELWRIKAKYKA